MVGDAVFLEVVGADLLGALAGADLAAAILRDRFLLLVHLHLVEPRPQHLHRLRAILDLRLLVLLRDDDAGRNVREADRRIGRVDALAAGSARAEGVDAQILVVDLDVDFLGFGQHRDRRRRGVESSGRFGRRHALHAMDAAFVLQAAVDAASLDGGDDFLEPADAGVAARHHVDAPALALGVLPVHPEQLAGEERGFVAAGAGADLEDDVLLVVGILRDQQDLQLGEQRVAFRDEVLELRRGRARASRRRRRPPAPRSARPRARRPGTRGTAGPAARSRRASWPASGYSDGLLWSSAEPSRAISSSYCRSTACSLSNMTDHDFCRPTHRIPAAGTRCRRRRARRGPCARSRR